MTACGASPGGCPSTADDQGKGATSFFLSILNLWYSGGLRQDPGRAAELPTQAGTYENGSWEVRVLLSTYGSRGGVEPVVGLSARLRALGTSVRGCAPPDGAAVEGCDALVATGVVPTGVWR
jgi:hypothetical protein